MRGPTAQFAIYITSTTFPPYRSSCGFKSDPDRELLPRARFYHRRVARLRAVWNPHAPRGRALGFCAEPAAPPGMAGEARSTGDGERVLSVWRQSLCDFRADVRHQLLHHIGALERQKPQWVGSISLAADA